MRTLVVGFVCLVVGSICGGAIASSGQTPTKATVTPPVAAAASPAAAAATTAPTAAPTVAAAPTAAPTAAPKPASTPLQPVARMGQGSTVTPIHLDRSNYKVTWSAQGGPDNMIVIIHQGSKTDYLVNEIPPDPSSGQTFFASPQGADYTLEVKASTLTWAITFTPI